MRLSSQSHPILFVALAFVSSMLAAYLCAAVYLVALNWSLPPTDGAYGQTIAQMISDPFVWLVATRTAGQTIAVTHAIRDLARLRRLYGRGRWRKRKGIVTVR